MAPSWQSRGPYNCRHDDREESNDPWHGRSDVGHPLAIVLAVSNCVYNLEVAFQGNNHKTDLSTHHVPSRLPAEV